MSEPTEREWLEGLRYEDKFPDGAMPESRQDAEHKPDHRILICLGPCHGEFYLPLDDGDLAVCPNDRTHPVAVYGSPRRFPGQVAHD
jgi:hypothetical protein